MTVDVGRELSGWWNVHFWLHDTRVNPYCPWCPEKEQQ